MKEVEYIKMIEYIEMMKIESKNRTSFRKDKSKIQNKNFYM